jgi:hypothetical protein
MKTRTPRTPVWLGQFFLCLCLATTPCCSGNGEGEFVLDERAWTERTQILLVETDGAVAAIELDLPFDPGRTFPDKISVSVEESTRPEGTHMEYAVKSEDGRVKLAILSAGQEGFESKDLKIELTYTLIGSSTGPKLFDQVEVVKVLDVAFNNKQIGWRWIR